MSCEVGLWERRKPNKRKFFLMKSESLTSIFLVREHIIKSTKRLAPIRRSEMGKAACILLCGLLMREGLQSWVSLMTGIRSAIR